MGTWGTAISSNDTYSDACSEFFDLYDDGLSVSEISEKLKTRFHETIDDPHDANNFWFALGRSQWECKELDPSILMKVEKIVESGSDLEIWRQLDAADGDLKKRSIALAKFLTKLRSEKPKARKRKKRVVREPIFEKGECLIFRLDNGNFGGALVLEAVACVGFGLNLVLTTRINQSDRPVPVDFTNCSVLLKSFACWNGEPDIKWIYSNAFKKAKHLFESVGKIDVLKTYDSNDYSLGFSYGSQWSGIVDAMNLQLDAESNGLATQSRAMKTGSFIGNSRWKFWK